MSCVALEELRQVWQNYPVDIRESESESESESGFIAK